MLGGDLAGTALSGARVCNQAGHRTEHTRQSVELRAARTTNVVAVALEVGCGCTLTALIQNLAQSYSQE